MFSEVFEQIYSEIVTIVKFLKVTKDKAAVLPKSSMVFVKVLFV